MVFLLLSYLPGLWPILICKSQTLMRRCYRNLLYGQMSPYELGSYYEYQLSKWTLVIQVLQNLLSLNVMSMAYMGERSQFLIKLVFDQGSTVFSKFFFVLSLKFITSSPPFSPLLTSSSQNSCRLDKAPGNLTP